MIGELLQLSRENEELRKEIDALKAELAQEREKSEGLRGALTTIEPCCTCPDTGHAMEPIEAHIVENCHLVIKHRALLHAKDDL